MVIGGDSIGAASDRDGLAHSSRLRIDARDGLSIGARHPDTSPADGDAARSRAGGFGGDDLSVLDHADPVRRDADHAVRARPRDGESRDGDDRRRGEDRSGDPARTSRSSGCEGRCVSGLAGRAWREQQVVTKDRAFDFLQLRRRIEAQPVDELSPRVPIDGERVCLSPGVIQGEHQLRSDPLS